MVKPSNVSSYCIITHIPDLFFVRFNGVKEEIINKMIKDSEEEYGKKRLRNKRRKYINKEGTIPK
jgi:hypothetical protein